MRWGGVQSRPLHNSTTCLGGTGKVARGLLASGGSQRGRGGRVDGPVGGPGAGKPGRHLCRPPRLDVRC
eukprot:2139954-Karenia_brevis.AAC.1